MKTETIIQLKTNTTLPPELLRQMVFSQSLFTPDEQGKTQFQLI